MNVGDHCFCQSCKKANTYAIERRRKLLEAAKQKEATKAKEDLRKMVEEIDRMKRELVEKDLIIEQHEEATLARIPEEILSQGSSREGDKSNMQLLKCKS